MKKIHLIACVAALTGLVAVPAAFAKRDKGTTPAQTTPSEVYAKYDKNNNGVLDPDEKDALKADFAKDPSGPANAYDVNKDSKLSDDEIAAIPATKTADAPAKQKKHKNK